MRRDPTVSWSSARRALANEGRALLDGHMATVEHYLRGLLSRAEYEARVARYYESVYEWNARNNELRAREAGR